MPGNQTGSIPIPITSSSSEEKELRVPATQKHQHSPHLQQRSNGGCLETAGRRDEYGGGRRGRVEEQNSRSESNIQLPSDNGKDPVPRPGHRSGDNSRSHSHSSGASKHRAAYAIKAEPISFMSMDDPAMSSKSMPATPAKRPAENEATDEEALKFKKGKLEEEENFKNPWMWSPMEEIVLLEGILEFQLKKGVTPKSNASSFFGFMKARFREGMNKSRLMEKVRRMKDRYLRTNLNDSSTPHERKCFKLSKKIWGDVANGIGSTGNGGDEKKASGGTFENSEKKSVSSPNDNQEEVAATAMIVEKVVEARQAEGGLDELYPNLMARWNSRVGDAGVDIVLKNMSLLGESELKKLDNEWKKHNIAELELYVRQTGLVLNAMKSQED
ncbi:hypothetical protein Dimus_009632 [Dionaea muscipula]